MITIFFTVNFKVVVQYQSSCSKYFVHARYRHEKKIKQSNNEGTSHSFRNTSLYYLICKCRPTSIFIMDKEIQNRKRLRI